MQSFRIAKRKSSKPEKSKTERNIELAEAISIPENLAMVACSECVRFNDVCYYDRKESVACAACLKHQRKCDGTFALEEFRKVGEQKKLVQAKSLQKQRELARLRQNLLRAQHAFLEAQSALATVETEHIGLQGDIAALEEISSRMLRREMQALGVFDSVPSDHEVALADPAFVEQNVPITDMIDWPTFATSSSSPFEL